MHRTCERAPAAPPPSHPGRDAVSLCLPQPVSLALTFLSHFFPFMVYTVCIPFSLLCSLSEYSDENMMDPYNLAICFGPTLLPIPPDRDQVMYQNNVNELTKTIIVHQEEIFPNDGGMVYEKCIVEEE